jgi:hypothetical protein
MLGLACIIATSPAQGNLNHLRGQTSPYLKRAVSQPVDWYPWGPEAFTRASELDRPILLDVGAVWCPWCSLMDRDTYTNVATADYINQHFVSIKVDFDSAPKLVAQLQRAQAVLNLPEPNQQWMPRMSPDGKFILYATSPQGVGGSSQRIMRVGSSGESPQFVMEVPRLGNFACPRLPADVCLVAQSSEDGKKVTITSFDPMQGKPREVLTLDIRLGTLYNWMPSPDCSRIAFMEYSPLQGVIRTLSLKGEPEHDIAVKGWTGLNSVDWAGDGESFLVSSQSPTSSTLLRVDMEGRATPLWDQRGAWRTWAIAAPNGRELAIQGMTSSSKVWMIENF